MIRRLSLITTLFCIGCVLAPAGAAAGTAKLVREPGNEREPASERVEYSAAPGEVNRLTLATVGSAGAVLVTDPAGVALGRGCARVVAIDSTRARCSAPGDIQIDGISASLGDRDDSAEVGAGLVAAVDGGPGDDQLTGSVLTGGPGDDTMRGDDLAGGPGNDILVTPDSPAGNLPDQSFSLIDESDANNGSDVIRGGSGRDYIRYTRRTAPVRIDLRATSGAGEAGENDRISGVENADGGRGDDVLIGTDARNELSGGGGTDRISGGRGDDLLFAEDIANAGRPGDRDRIDGGPGDDIIDGSDGPNVIRPGPGEDRVTGAAGSDRIVSRDHSIDSVSCGMGSRDAVRADALDFVPRSCERLRRRGDARAVPLFISVNSHSDAGPSVQVGCSIDGPQVCRGTVKLYRGGLRGAVGFRARRGRVGFVLFRSRLRGLEGTLVRVVVSARTRRGRGRSVTRTHVVDSEG